MTSLFSRRNDEERSMTLTLARARFVWLLVAALLLPLAASLSRNTKHTSSFENINAPLDELMH
jgi:hypothetical protein